MKKTLFALVATMFCIVKPASAQEVSALVGLDVSAKLGEAPGGAFGLRVEKKGLVTWESTTFIDTSQKLNSVAPGINAGWKAGESFAFRFGNQFGAIVGADARYRNGGPWVKETIWGIFGGGWPPFFYLEAVAGGAASRSGGIW